MTWRAVWEESYFMDRLYLVLDKAVVAPLVLRKGDAAIIAEPTMVSPREDMEDGNPCIRGFMQAMLDEAWEHGLRPRGFEDHTNELTAVRYHLEDMRKLVKLA